MPLCKTKNLTSLFPLFMISSVVVNVGAVSNLGEEGSLENNSELGKTINLPSEAFLDFLASGIKISSNDKSLSNQEANSTQFIDPMEIQELDNIGLLSKLNLPASKGEPIQSINLIKENKE